MKDVLLVILIKAIITILYILIAFTTLLAMVFAVTMLIPTLVACIFLIVHGENVLTVFANSDPKDVLLILSPIILIPIDTTLILLLGFAKKAFNL